MEHEEETDEEGAGYDQLAEAMADDASAEGEASSGGSSSEEEARDDSGGSGQDSGLGHEGSEHDGKALVSIRIGLYVAPRMLRVTC